MNKSFKKIISLGSIYSLGSLSQKALSFFFIPIYTTFLSIQDYGIVGLMSITIGLVTRVVSSPINNAFLRFYYNPEYKEKNGVLLFNLFLLNLLKTTCLALIFWRISGYLAGVLFDDINLVHIVKIYALILFFQPFETLFASLLRMLEKAKYFVFISISRLLLSACLILYLLIGLKMGVLALILGNLFGSVFTVIMILPVFIKKSTFKLSPSLLIPPLKYAYPLLMQGYSNFLIQSGDRYVLRIFTSVSTVGLYSFGYNLADIIQIALVRPLQQALAPIILKQEDNPKAIRYFLNKGATYFYIIGLFFCFFVSLFSREFLMLLARRKEFWGSWVIVPVITFSHIQHGLAYFTGWGMGMMKKSYHLSGTILISAVVNIGLNFLFVPHWGILGAAFATMISYIIWNFLRAYYSAKFYDLHFEVRRLLHITVIGFGLYGLSLLTINSDSLVFNISIKFFLLLCYPLMLFLTGFFYESEKDYMLELMQSLRRDGIKSILGKIRSLQRI